MQRIETIAGWTGVWIRDSTHEAFVSCSPVLRLLIFRRLGGISHLLFRPAAGPPLVGLRTWFVEQPQTVHPREAGNLPASILCSTQSSATLQTADSMVARIRIGWEIALRRGKLCLHTTLINLDPEPRRLGIWQILALPPAGVISVHGRRLEPRDPSEGRWWSIPLDRQCSGEEKWEFTSSSGECSWHHPEGILRSKLAPTSATSDEPNIAVYGKWSATPFSFCEMEHLTCPSSLAVQTSRLIIAAENTHPSDKVVPGD